MKVSKRVSKSVISKVARIFTSCLLVTVMSPLTANLAAAQDATGRVTGRILDSETAGPLSGVQVFLGDNSIGTRSDINGRYLLDRVPAGAVEVVAQIIGFATKTITDVTVTAGEVVTLDISLDETALQLAAITVTAEIERGANAALLQTRRTSNAVTDAVGSEDIRKSPAADAADVAQRMTGVTVSDGKYVFVRGLGERYSQTSFNGSPLPSPEPEREVVPLDIFPSGFLESLTTQKSYTPDRPADFSGGAVEIKTKDFPSSFQLSFGIGTSFNSQSQFQGNFLTYNGGDNDFFGDDDGTRGLPEEVTDLIGGLADQTPMPRDAASAPIRELIGQSLRRDFTPFIKDTPVNRSFDLSVGGSTGLGGDREFGYFFAGTYSDDYVILDDEQERKFRTSSFDPSIPAELRGANVDIAFERGTRSIGIGGIGNLAFNLSPQHQLRIKTTFNRNSDDEARTYNGFNGEDIGGIVRGTRLRFISRTLSWGQVSGDHQLFGDSRLEWKAAVARADRDEPGLRETLLLSDGDENGPFFLENSGESGRYFFSQLVDEDRNGQLDWTFPFEFGDQTASVKVGGAYRERQRDFAARRFRWDFVGGITDDLDNSLTDESIVGTSARAGQFTLQEIVEPGDLYDAEDDRTAGYAMIDVPLGSRLRAIAGARFEKYNLSLVSRGDELASLDESDVLPALNLVFDLTDDMKLRAAGSRTLDRPEFRELAPFQFTEATSLRQIFGEPALQQAEVINADLRWDWFFAPGELLSASVFYKDFDKPIEQVFVAAASTAYSFTNADKGELIGVELDSRIRLARFNENLRNVTFGANLSIIDSEVTVEEGGAFVPTNPVRELEGQASYVLNTNLLYADPFARWEGGIFYNLLGERLTAAGGGGVPDIMEQPRGQLDATFKFPLPGNVSVKLKGTNLLDSEYRFEQEANGVTQVQRRYKIGRTFSLGLSWDVY